MYEESRNEKSLKKQVKFKKDYYSNERSTDSQAERPPGVSVINDIPAAKGRKDIRFLKPIAAKLPYPVSDILKSKGDYLETAEYFYVTDIIIDILKNLKTREKGNDAGILGDILLVIVAGTVIGLVFLLFLG